MANERAPIGFDEDVADKLRAMNSKKTKPPKEILQQGAKQSGFKSREAKAKADPVPTKETPARPQFVRPKRTEQLNFKVTEETYALFYACVAASGQTTIGPRIDEAILLLADKYGVK